MSVIESVSCVVQILPLERARWFVTPTITAITWYTAHPFLLGTLRASATFIDDFFLLRWARWNVATLSFPERTTFLMGYFIPMNSFISLIPSPLRAWFLVQIYFRDFGDCNNIKWFFDTKNTSPVDLVSICRRLYDLLLDTICTWRIFLFDFQIVAFLIYITVYNVRIIFLKCLPLRCRAMLLSCSIQHSELTNDVWDIHLVQKVAQTLASKPLLAIRLYAAAVLILARSTHGHHGGIEALTAAPLNIILLSLLSFALYKEVAHYVLVATVKIDKTQENDTDWRYSTKESTNVRDKVQDAVDCARVEFPVLTHFKSYRVLPVVLIR